MKLVEILARELEEWPEAVQTYAQDDDGTVGASDGNQVRRYSGKGWSSGENEWVTEAALNGKKLKLASDAKTAIITRADWEAERARIATQEAAEKIAEKFMKPKSNKDGWIRHRGGKCPVEAMDAVDVRFRSGVIKTDCDYLSFRWQHTDEPGDIMAWRPHNADNQIEQVVVDNVKAFNDQAEMPAAKYFDGPLQWRDRIREIDREQDKAEAVHKAATEARDAERADLVAKLKAEGLALVQAQQEDMSNPANWKAGDMVECLCTTEEPEFTAGKLYEIDYMESNWCNVIDDVGDENALHPSFFKWHSRPSR